jgi:DUF917 family protein
MSFVIASEDVSALAVGAGLLACGGGGNPYYGELIARRLVSESGAVRVVGLEETAPDGLAVFTALMGAPLVGIEKPPSVRALRAGLDAVERALGAPVGAFVSVEVGGAQSMLPLVLAAVTGRPLLDGDGMGRAFPEAQMCTFLLLGFAPGTPFAVSDDHGLLWRVPRLPIGIGRATIGGTGRAGRLAGVGLERILRRYCAWKGGQIYFTVTIDRASLARTLVPGTLGRALEIGRAVLAARSSGGDPVHAILGASDGQRLFGGKVVDVDRRFRGGHDWGRLRMEGLEGDRDRRAEIDFKNEYLVLRVEERVVLTVPDLIAVVETETGAPITTEVLRPGLRASVVGFASTPLYHTAEALGVVGPRAFGYDLPFVPLPRAS